MIGTVHGGGSPVKQDGCIRISNGLLLQWGIVTTTGDADNLVQVNFKEQYKKVPTISLTPVRARGSAISGPYTDAVTISGFKVDCSYVWSNATKGGREKTIVHWIAIGY